jgi:deoxyribodipyrimidine photolyase-like uncharacterized protein
MINTGIEMGDKAPAVVFPHQLFETTPILTEYIESGHPNSDVRDLLPFLKKQNVSRLHMIDVSDDWLEKRIRKGAAENGISLEVHTSPLFLNERNEIQDYFSQYADGGLMSTKPYISSSNYLLKMSDFPKGNWEMTWDSLFWRFVAVRRDQLGRNPRLRMLVSSFDRMSVEKQKNLRSHAEKFLQEIL